MPKKKDNTCDTEGGTTLTSFINIRNTSTPFAEVWKSWHFPQISLLLKMAG
jgi:hypothetical protein